MNCLCCGKPLEAASESGWHNACIRSFFGTQTLPNINVDDEALRRLADEASGKGLTVPGVQKKLSLHLVSDRKNPKLTIVDYPTGFILKPQVDAFAALPESEHLVMSMADASGITTVPHALIRINTGLAYITKRVDRNIKETESGFEIEMRAMEDFCQLEERLTEDKYRSSYERCAKVIRHYSSRVGIDMTEFFMRIVFSFLVGNSDMHLKNFSLIETQEGSRRYILAPAYDLLPVNANMPEDKEETALSLNGKKSRLKREDFLCLADACNIPRTVADKVMNKLLSYKPKWISMCEASLLPSELRNRLCELIEERTARLEGGL